MVRRCTFLSVFALVAGTVALAGCSDWSYAPPMHGNFMTEPVNHPRVDAGTAAGRRQFHPGNRA